ncbi:DUF4178 domain-containing protein [Noviluteimonas dokdonensis]|uniref:DUF4178 domain-containing protein n=1 Tax=Noviluteimonas dokdonensis TaxID=414050 RepID=UPI0013764F13|nr:DUF4178 domain-containing protein [Lysobacter dokdonensis]
MKFESAGAVMVVCAACRSTITKDADAARATGHMAAVIEDASPVQLRTRGSNGARKFTVVGRLRMAYGEGAWNEWYIAFDDGTDGWLSDASGQYAVLRRLPDSELKAPLPAYAKLSVGEPVQIGETWFLVSDRRESRCIGGEGELPVNAADGWTAHAADCRKGNAFATIDYSDGAPVAYVGMSANRTDLDKTTLRSNEDVAETTGRYRGNIMPLDCPNCGGAITIVAAMATQVVCPSCSSLLDCSGERTEIIEAHKRSATFKSTLPLGALGKFEVDYRIIGIMRCDVPRDMTEPAWTEYLLFNPERGYLWLVETEEGWSRVTVSDEWPTSVTDNHVVFRGKPWPKLYEYGSKVTAVFGAFNWRVRKGDTSNVTDFRGTRETLTREQTAEEVTWSVAQPLHITKLATAFRMPELAAALQAKAIASAKRSPFSSDDDDSDDQFNPLSIAAYASMALFVFSEALTWAAIFFGVIAVWAPLLILWWKNEELP